MDCERDYVKIMIVYALIAASLIDSPKPQNPTLLKPQLYPFVSTKKRRT